MTVENTLWHDIKEAKPVVSQIPKGMFCWLNIKTSEPKALFLKHTALLW